MLSHETINTLITAATGACVTAGLAGLRSSVIKLTRFVEQVNEDHGQLDHVAEVVDGHTAALSGLGIAHAFPKLRRRRKDDSQ